ncbi:MAG: glutamate--tRNA ligase, partial [Acetobacter orientalis]
ALMPGLKERARTLVELAESAAFLGRHVPLEFNAKAEKILTPEARTILDGLARELAAVADFTPENIDAALRRFAEREGHKLGQVAQPVRAAVSGSNTSPGIDATLFALGKDETLARIGAVLNG